MIMLFTAELPPTGPRDAVLLLDRFSQFNPSLRPRKGGGGAAGGGYVLCVPSGRVPLRTLRLLEEFCRERHSLLKWRLLGVDDDGNPTVPVSEEAVTP
jgi:hypothetical protein